MTSLPRTGAAGGVPIATVTAVVVSHDGARWLPAVLDGLTGQTRAVDRVVAVDTGSSDHSRQLLEERIGPGAVRGAKPGTPYGEAVALALHHLPPEQDEWVWLLHDDSAPTPDALATLLAAAEQNSTADVLGPKLREWPSLRRLLEVGVTISGTGRRETGLERGEYDQGQHDDLHEVLAVNTAGMLVRRPVLESLGFDRRLPVFGNDIDFGWRAARAGHRTLAVPDAVVFHVEAAHRGVRRTPLTGRHHRRGERQAALYTLLANCSLAVLPWQSVRLLLGSLLRALAFLLVRAPGEALEEVSALARVYLRPDRVLLARVRRRRTARVRAREVRHLLAPWWLPYRHGLDFVVDLAVAVGRQVTDISAARRARRAGVETGPVPEEAESLPADTGWMARLVASPVAGVFAVLVLAALWSARGLLGAGMLSGGALLPAPEGVMHWWTLYLESSHQIATGSTVPAAPYLVPLAALGTLLLGKAWLVVDLLFLLAVPLSAAGGYVFLRRVTDSRAAALWGAAAYGLLPVLTGAVQEGRLGTVAGAAVLPWVAHAAVFLGPRHSQDRRWRAAWRTALWLAVLTAFVPLAYPLAVVLAVVGVGAGLVTAPGVWRRGATWGPVVVPVLATPVLLLPWALLVWEPRGFTTLLFEAGLPAPSLADPLTWWQVALGRPGGEAPWWITLGLVLAAVAALARPDTRRPVLMAWTVLVAALGLVVLLAGGSFVPPGRTLSQPLWLGFPLLLVQAAGVCAAALAASGIRARLSGASFGWRQPLGVVVAVVALLAPVVGLGWWVVAGSDDPLDRRAPTAVPEYMQGAVAADSRDGVLVVRGNRKAGFEHVLLRGPGLRLGDDTVLPGAADQRRLTRLVEHLVAAPEPEDAEALTGLGVGFVFAPRPADLTLAANLDSLSGLTTGSAARPGSRAWQVEAGGASGPAVKAADEPLHTWLLAVQGLAVLTVAVLAAPTRRVAR